MAYKGFREDIEERKLQEDVKYLESEYRRLLSERGVILLKHMDEPRQRRILDMVSDYPDVRAYTILDGQEKQIVLKYSNRDTSINLFELNKDAYQAYLAKDYDKAIYEYKTILECSPYSKATIYELIGMCYYKKNDIPNAITYLTIATYNSSKENGKRKIDHSKLISELLNKKVSLSHNHENIFSTKEYSMHKNFVNNETYNYNIPDVEGIFSYARDNHMDIEQVGEKLDLTLEERDLLKLICAREYFKDGDFKEGNKFLNAVDATKHKSPLVKYVLNETREKKRFYQYRQTKKETKDNKEIKTLVLLKPGKRR